MLLFVIAGLVFVGIMVLQTVPEHTTVEWTETIEYEDETEVINHRTELYY